MLMEILHNLQYDAVFFRNGYDFDPLRQSIPAAAWFVLVSTCITLPCLIVAHLRLKPLPPSVTVRLLLAHFSDDLSLFLSSSSVYFSSLSQASCSAGNSVLFGRRWPETLYALCSTQSIYLLTFRLGTRRLKPGLSGTHVHSRSYRSTSRLPPHAWTRSLQPQTGAKPDWT
jgi:hypothetical protein